MKTLGYEQYGMLSFENFVSLTDVRNSDTGRRLGILGYLFPIQISVYVFLLSQVTRAMAHLYPESCKGTHINWIFASPPKWTTENPEPEYTDREKVALGRGQDVCRRWANISSNYIACWFRILLVVGRWWKGISRNSINQSLSSHLKSSSFHPNTKIHSPQR